MKTIPLTHGAVALVDDCDFGALSKIRWYRIGIEGYFYAAAMIDGAQRLMHRVILGINATQVGDHINHDGLDNRRENLRACTHAENMRNRKANKKTLNGLKGIEVESRAGHGTRIFRVRIRVNGKKHSGGCYPTREEAARAYDRLALKYHGAFAKTNFPRELYA